jgi:hypothetical protein
MKQFKGILLAMISSATFGMIPLFALPVIRGGMGVDSVMFYRFALSSAVVGAYLLLRRADLRVTLREFGVLFGLGALYAFTSLLLTIAYLYIPSGVATTIHFLYPLLVAAIMALFFKDRISVSVMVAALAAVAGVWLLSGGTDAAVGMADTGARDRSYVRRLHRRRQQIVRAAYEGTQNGVFHPAFGNDNFRREPVRKRGNSRIHSGLVGCRPPDFVGSDSHFGIRFDVGVGRTADRFDDDRDSRLSRTVDRRRARDFFPRRTFRRGTVRRRRADRGSGRDGDSRRPAGAVLRPAADSGLFVEFL